MVTKMFDNIYQAIETKRKMIEYRNNRIRQLQREIEKLDREARTLLVEVVSIAHQNNATDYLYKTFPTLKVELIMEGCACTNETQKEVQQ